jgi:hypothetical protein
LANSVAGTVIRDHKKPKNSIFAQKFSATDIRDRYILFIRNLWRLTDTDVRYGHCGCQHCDTVSCGHVRTTMPSAASATFSVGDRARFTFSAQFGKI